MNVKQTNAILYLLIIGIICISLGGFLSYRELSHRPFPRPREQNVSLIQGWMTLHYVSRVYLVPEDELSSRLHIDVSKNRNISINKLAKNLGKTSDTFLEEVQKAVTDFQTTHPKPPH